MCLTPQHAILTCLHICWSVVRAYKSLRFTLTLDISIAVSSKVFECYKTERCDRSGRSARPPSLLPSSSVPASRREVHPGISLPTFRRWIHLEAPSVRLSTRVPCTHVKPNYWSRHATSLCSSLFIWILTITHRPSVEQIYLLPVIYDKGEINLFRWKHSRNTCVCAS